jgi:hypothetical protein
MRWWKEIFCLSVLAVFIALVTVNGELLEVLHFVVRLGA